MSSDPTVPVPRQCTAKSKASGLRCRRSSVLDGTVCPMHGGKAPQVKAAAARRRQERAALLAVESFGLPIKVDAHTALLEELHRTAGAVAWLGAAVADLDRDEIVWGRTREKVGGEDHGTTHAAGVNVWVGLWQDERKHLVVISRECIKSGIEERRVRLAESAGQQLASVVRAVLDRMLVAVLAAVLEVLPSDEARVAFRAAFEAAWAQSALVIVPDEFRRLGETVTGEVTS